MNEQTQAARRVLTECEALITATAPVAALPIGQDVVEYKRRAGAGHLWPDSLHLRLQGLAGRQRCLGQAASAALTCR